MATRIHHGAPGSYKSFTLVQRFAIPALIEGRAVVTNIRGFNSVDRVIAQFPDKDFSPNARIIWIDTTTQAGRTKMAKWFHWCPFGAMIIIDEVQQVYPDRRDFKLESLDKYTPEEGEIIEDIGLAEGRPEDVFTAYDKQRHYNWDIFCSTPNIAKVKKEIREVSEWAYRHRDLSGLLPWKKNTWIEHQHDAESSGKAASHRVGSPTEYKADPRVFACYQSTATGEHVASKAGRSIFQDKKLVGLFCLIIGCLLFMGYMFNHRQNLKAQHAGALSSPATQAPSRSPSPDVNNRPPAVLPPTLRPVVPDTPLTLDRALALRWSINGVMVDDLPQIPPACTLTSASVRCAIQTDNADNSLIRAAFNRICYPVKLQTRCELIFFVNRPDIPPETKTAALSKALPF